MSRRESDANINSWEIVSRRLETARLGIVDHVTGASDLCIEVVKNYVKEQDEFGKMLNTGNSTNYKSVVEKRIERYLIPDDYAIEYIAFYNLAGEYREQLARWDLFPRRVQTKFVKELKAIIDAELARREQESTLPQK